VISLLFRSRKKPVKVAGDFERVSKGLEALFRIRNARPCARADCSRRNFVAIRFRTRRLCIGCAAASGGMFRAGIASRAGRALLKAQSPLPLVAATGFVGCVRCLLTTQKYAPMFNAN
jgi:hypothetical protein